MYLRLTALALFLLTFCAQASDDIEQVLRPVSGQLSAGIKVVEQKSHKTLYQQNPNQLFHPGSNTKLFTSFAALKVLGPNFRYKTSLHYTPTLENGTLSSDVAIKFSGDPSLKKQDYQALITYLKQHKISVIEGDFILDDSVFSGPVYAPGWTWDDFDWYYAPPVEAFSLDNNQLNVVLTPAKTIGGTATLASEEPLLKLTHHVTTVAPEHADDCPLEVRQQANQLAVHGCFGIKGKPSTLRLANQDLRQYLPILIASQLKEQGITLHGQVRFDSQDLPQQTQHLSDPLSEMIMQVLTFSNNLYSDSLVKTMGYHQSGIGSFHEGIKVVNQTLKQSLGLDDTFVLKDGSGLSQYNLVSAVHINRLLEMAQYEPFFPIFKQALARPGQGSLEHRLLSKDVLEKVYAKTGTLSGHSTLCGYFGSSDNTVTFTILLNNSHLPKSKLIEIEDSLVLAIQSL